MKKIVALVSLLLASSISPANADSNVCKTTYEGGRAIVFSWNSDSLRVRYMGQTFNYDLTAVGPHLYLISDGADGYLENRGNYIRVLSFWSAGILTARCR